MDFVIKIYCVCIILFVLFAFLVLVSVSIISTLDAGSVHLSLCYLYIVIRHLRRLSSVRFLGPIIPDMISIILDLFHALGGTRWDISALERIVIHFPEHV